MAINNVLFMLFPLLLASAVIVPPKGRVKKPEAVC
jgi:hypothetical protein